jgi:TRAP-type C4-dicarboxylate transport system permease large subunit
VGKISIEKVTKALLPYYFSMVVVLMLVTFIPEITMFLPNLLMPGN